MKKYCDYCGKEQTEIEFMVGQCNECDPFEDEEKLILLYGEPEYKGGE